MSTYDTFLMDPTPRTLRRSGPFGEGPLKTVAEAVAFCERIGLDPSEVSLAHNYVQWDAVETADEVAGRMARAKAARSEHVARIREMYEEYADRGLYAPTTTADPERAALAEGSDA